MKKSFVTDYSVYILFNALGCIIRVLPNNFRYFLGARLGDLLFHLDFKHRAVVYSNIKRAFVEKFSPSEILKLTQKFYRTLGQNLIEIFLIPVFDKEYLNKYIKTEGLHNILDSFKKGNGVIIIGVHEGSWELSNVISAHLGFPFNMLVREQAHPKLNKLLNEYRTHKGYKLIHRKNQTRLLLETLKKNEAIGMTADQGGKGGLMVDFFGRNASMSTGAVKIALRQNTPIVPVFFTREKGPYIKIFIEPAFEIKKTNNFKKDVRDNLQRLIAVFEKYILKYPHEYLWTYKIYKYSSQKEILILTDGKAGHLRQSQSVANIVSSYYRQKHINAIIKTREVKFKNRLSKLSLIFNSCSSGKYNCQGCLLCMKISLKADVYNSLIRCNPDVVISCGFSVAAVNFLLSRHNLAKSIVIMRPSVLSIRRFDLVVMSKHDNPPKRKNVVVTEGALNLIDEDYLTEQSKRLLGSGYIRPKSEGNCLGLLIGGDAKYFHLEKSVVSDVLNQIKSACRKFDIDILLTTSRRTSKDIEDLIKSELIHYPACKLMIIANEKNIPEAVGGILGLSQIIVISPESISMISEAINSKKYVIVFKSKGLSAKHSSFLTYCASKKYIYLVESVDLVDRIEYIFHEKPAIHTIRDDLLINEAVKRIL